MAVAVVQAGRLVVHSRITLWRRQVVVQKASRQCHTHSPHISRPERRCHHRIQRHAHLLELLTHSVRIRPDSILVVNMVRDSVGTNATLVALSLNLNEAAQTITTAQRSTTRGASTAAATVSAIAAACTAVHTTTGSTTTVPTAASRNVKTPSDTILAPRLSDLSMVQPKRHNIRVNKRFAHLGSAGAVGGCIVVALARARLLMMD
jgi:hypothetical protein